MFPEVTAKYVRDRFLDGVEIGPFKQYLYVYLTFTHFRYYSSNDQALRSLKGDKRRLKDNV